MTAEEAIDSIREDIDSLERKNLVKPGHIRRRRAELDAIADKLIANDDAIFMLESDIANLNQALHNERNRTSILANMLTMLGIPWHRRANDPSEHEATVMQHAAAIASANNKNIADQHTPKWALLKAMRAAILCARMEIGLRPTHHLTQLQHGQEEERRKAA